LKEKTAPGGTTVGGQQGRPGFRDAFPQGVGTHPLQRHEQARVEAGQVQPLVFEFAGHLRQVAAQKRPAGEPWFKERQAETLGHAGRDDGRGTGQQLGEGDGPVAAGLELDGEL